MSDSNEHSWLKKGSNLGSEDVRAYYDQWAESYDGTLQSWNYQAPKEAAAMLKPLIAAEASIFDAGCGTGLSGRALRDAGYSGRIDGCDLSADSVALAKDRNIYNAVRVMNFQELPLPVDSDTYDVTICIGVLTYISELLELLSEFCRITKSGGYILFTHREDLVEEQNFIALTETLAEKGLWEKIEITEPRPYLPDHPDFGNNIGAIYGLFRVK